VARWWQPAPNPTARRGELASAIRWAGSTPSSTPVIDARGLAVATSGDAVNAYEVGGRRYSHIIDPATDEPVINDVASVTVLAPSAMTADALSTALMVMGPDQGMAFAEAHALPVLYLMRAPDGLFERASRRFDTHRLT